MNRSPERPCGDSERVTPRAPFLSPAGLGLTWKPGTAPAAPGILFVFWFGGDRAPQHRKITVSTCVSSENIGRLPRQGRSAGCAPHPTPTLGGRPRTLHSALRPGHCRTRSLRRVTARRGRATQRKAGPLRGPQTRPLRTRTEGRGTCLRSPPRPRGLPVSGLVVSFPRGAPCSEPSAHPRMPALRSASTERPLSPGGCGAVGVGVPPADAPGAPPLPRSARIVPRGVASPLPPTPRGSLGALLGARAGGPRITLTCERP